MIIWKAPYLGYKLVTEVVNSTAREYPEHIQDNAEKYWVSKKAENPHLFDGPVWCMHSWRVEESDLVLKIELTSYKYILYTLFSPSCCDIPRSVKPNALGSSAITVTSDGKVVLGLRKTNVGTTPSVWHLVPAGNVDSVDMVGHIQTELHEELDLTLAPADSLAVFGMFNTGLEQGEKTEMVFVIRLASISFDELCKRFERLNPEENEHEKLIGVTELPQDLKMTHVANAVLSTYYNT